MTACTERQTAARDGLAGEGQKGVPGGGLPGSRVRVGQL
jgi:hypothetical protein